MITLQGTYFEKMAGSMSSFSDVVTIRERIENGLKTRRISGTASCSNLKSSHLFTIIQVLVAFYLK